MSTIVAIARKELRTYFLSPVALLFVATFLLWALFTFFWIEGFFGRNIADVRPLFEWLPLLLVFLVPALGMRLWSEEERAGTMELLRTFPLSNGALVLGKFLSGLALLGVALLLTLPLPLTVELVGDLDWGPVVGGYLGALLVAGVYLAITLCISALTRSQLVALVFGTLASALLYAVGSTPVTDLLGHRAGELLRGLGTGSRFASILRGVIDLRDLLYYLSLILFFLFLNGVILAAKRWGHAQRSSGRRFHTVLGALLLGLNLAALNLVAAPLATVRLDLTQHNEYSISPVTERLLAGLDEPLVLRGYFSAKTHPLLAPLVPRIRDMIEEYGVVGGEKVRAEIVDPTTDPEMEREAAEGYGITSVPFQFADRHEAAVVNSYFHILVRYGNQFETLGFEQLIEVQVHGMDLDVNLRNLEYDLTSTIQKVVYGFQGIESVSARLPAPATFTLLSSSEGLPSDIAAAPARIAAVAEQIAARSGGRIAVEHYDPSQPGAPLTAEALESRYGIKPYPLSLFSDQTVFLHLLLRVGERHELVQIPEELTDANIKEALVAALKRAGPGSLKTLGVADSSGDPAALSYRTLREQLAQTYRVETVQLDSGRIAGEIDVLLLLDPRQLDEKALFAIDQFLMRGGSVIIAAGSHVINPQSREGLQVVPVESGLEPLLAKLGVRIAKQVVLDMSSASFPVPVERNIGGFTLREIQMLQYPAFVDIPPEQMAGDNPALAGLPGVVLHWPSPVYGQSVSGDEPADGTATTDAREVLLRSSPDAWLLDQIDAQPNFERYGELGWPAPSGQQSVPLAVAKMGPFESYFAGRQPPALDAATAPGDGAKEAAGKRQQVIDRSPRRSRLVVIGSANFVSDLTVQLSQQISDAHLANMQLVQNLVDWCLEDVELLSIRSRGAYTRTLAQISPALRTALELGNYAFALLSVLVLGLLSLLWRRNVRPLPVGRPAQSSPEPNKEAAA